MTFSRAAINTLTSSPICRLMQPLRKKVVPVFLLHRFSDKHRSIHGHTQEHLEAVLTYLGSHGYTVVSVRRVVDALMGQEPLPPRSVAFTLDDGFVDQAKILPVFEKFLAPVTFFLATDMLDSRHWSWDYKLEYIFRNTTIESLQLDLGAGLSTVNFSDLEDRRILIRNLKKIYKKVSNDRAELAVAQFSRQLGVEVPEEAPEEYAPMSWEEARRLESDYIEFGPHSKRHVILSQISEQEAENEIVGSWEAVKKNLANPVPVFCYPSGREGIDFGLREQQIVSRAGFKAAFSADAGYIDLANPSNNNLYSLKRFSFPNDLTYFKQYCSWLEYAKERIVIT